MRPQWMLPGVLAPVLMLVLAACGGDGDEAAPPAAPTGSPATVADGGGPSIEAEPAAVSPGETFNVRLRDLPPDIVSGAREACVGVIDPAGGAQPVKFGRVPPGQADRDIQGVLPPDTKAGAYQVTVASCDFSPGSAIASAELTVR